MFRAVFVLLTCAAVLWHALVGCCAHHEHATSQAIVCLSPCCGCGQSAGAENAASAFLAEGHDHRVVDCSDSCEPGDSTGGCDGGRCAFVAPGAGGDAPLKSIQVDWSDLYAAFSPSCELTPSAAFVQTNDSEPPLRGEMRLHLALGVLRI